MVQSRADTHDQQERPREALYSEVPGWLELILVCPICKGSVQKAGSSYSCRLCSREYPVRHGIPDFRLHPDPYISIEDELAKIEKLFDGRGKSFHELLSAYYDLSPENPPSLNHHYISAMDAAVGRGRGLLQRLIARFPKMSRIRLLDLGCGTGGMLAASVDKFERAVGVDVALRWMLIGRQRLRELGLDVPLVCANAESLPFAARTFDAVTADAVLEHVREPAAMRDETMRVLQSGGAYYFTTNNRYSVLPEPHLRIPAFGLLPRSWMERAAMRLRRTPYRARLMSLRELRSLFRGVGTIELPAYNEGELGQSHESVRRAWDSARRFAIVRAAVWPLAPQYFISGTKSALQ